MWQDLPELGTGVLYAILVAASYTMGLALASGAGRPRLLQAARLGAFGTVALVAFGVLVLAYAFVTHDFRVKYVANYSDRTMSVPYLIAALWGGQDGSLLWWLFLTATFSGACVHWLRRRYLELQPYVIAVLMSILVFFAILMLFAANPFSTSVAGAPPDGQGLNHQLRNFYMILHPPALYLGFTASAIPFAFAIAALITGRLDNEWIVATRKWMLFAWLFLSIGNALGMLWAYEELGWGGYWAWDPVENAACLPWFTASAFVHSIMIQERRGLLKIWNVLLICATFFLTIFGTFLTRSGLIASVHSFAQSGIGIFFVYYMGFIVAGCAALIVLRIRELRTEGRLESVLSRETAFVANNWGLVSIAAFITVATIWPRISEWLLDQKSTLGPAFYNAWIPPVALVVFALMGVAPLLGWRKTSPELFAKSFPWPVGTALIAMILHLAVGERIGFSAFYPADNIYPGTALGAGLQAVSAKLPLITVALCGFNVAVVVQEFARGVAARRRGTRRVSIVASLVGLVAKSRRRYGGYIVHVGIILMFLGFTGRAWGVDKEVSMAPGDRVRIEEYELTYVGPRVEFDEEKRMEIADIDVSRNGRPVGRIAPAKFIYKAAMPSTEIARYMSLRNDLYVVVGMLNVQTKVAAFQLHINPLVSFIWFGVGVLILGAIVAMWPEVSQHEEMGAFSYVRAAASIATAVMVALLLATGPAVAYGQVEAPRSEETPGLLNIHNETERELFKSLNCPCPHCAFRRSLAEDPYDCGDQYRTQARAFLASGMTVAQARSAFVKQHGPEALAVPPNEGAAKALWVAPVGAMALAAVFLGLTLRRWKRSSDGAQTAPAAQAPKTVAARDEYDDRIDQELRALDSD